MAQLAAVAVAFVASAYKGMEQKKAGIEQAGYLGDAGRRRMAATTREVSEEADTKELMNSRAIVAAATSGAGLHNPNVIKTIGDLNAEGMYRMASKLWQGQNDSEGLYFRAEAARREGEAAWTAGLINGVTSAVSTYSALGGSFGGGKAASGARGTYGGSGAMGTSAQGLPYSPIANPPKTKLWSKG